MGEDDLLTNNIRENEQLRHNLQARQARALEAFVQKAESINYNLLALLNVATALQNKTIGKEK